MGVFFIYILKSSVCLILFYLFFRLLLSKETFHRFNRMALLGVLFFSLLIPCIEVTTRHQVEVHQAVLSIEQLLLMAVGGYSCQCRRSAGDADYILGTDCSAGLSGGYSVSCLSQYLFFDLSLPVGTFRQT